MVPLLLATILSNLVPATALPAPAQREFRGVWVATVDRIDWPPKNVNDVEKQKQALLAIVDEAAKIHLNAIVFQVRPMGDALYSSSYEPWSEYLTGKQGQPPNPMWDPLEFAVREAHARGLELHAWFNPYRVWHPAAKGQPASNYLGKTHPDWVRDYGKYKWLDPGARGVREWSEKVILDVVKRYDIDGIHIDDYFYPYPERDSRKKDIPFPDDQSWKAYASGGGAASRGDWRRSNVNEFVSDLYRRVKDVKPWVKFGISPFGIYRPGYPSQIKAGIDQFNDLYADPLRWFQQGWCDYLSPQLYWPINRKAQSYPVLAQWWADQDTLHRHLWIGNYISGISNASGVKELLDEIAVTRSIPGAEGNVFFSMEAFMGDHAGMDEALLDGPYRDLALIPASPWLSAAKPRSPKLSKREGAIIVGKPGRDAYRYAIYVQDAGSWRLAQVCPAAGMTVREPSPTEIAVSALDRYGNESDRSVMTTG